MRKRKRINQVSLKKIDEMIREYPIRQTLCIRAGGQWMIDKSITYKTRVGPVLVPCGHCEGGLCDDCKQPPDFLGLHPHEKVFRSKGKEGIMSLDNSIMLCYHCHMKMHNLKPIESKPQ